MGGVNSDAAVCRHRWAENSSLESSNQSDPLSGDRSDSHASFHNFTVCLSSCRFAHLCLSSGDTVGFAVPRRSGDYVAGVGRSIVAVDWSAQMMTSLVDVDENKPNNRLNDGKVDPLGRLLAGVYLSACSPGSATFCYQCCYINSFSLVSQVQWGRRSDQRRLRRNKGHFIL